MVTDTIDVDIDSEDSWAQASELANGLAPVPPQISTAIQTLWANHVENRQRGVAEIKWASFNSLKMLERSSMLKTPMYFAASELFPDRFKLQEDDTIKALLTVLEPGLFAAILGLVYCHRRLNKLCKVAAPSEWETLSKEIVLNMELGYIVGSTFERIGPEIGILAGGIRYVALAAALVKHREQYSRYRNLKRNKLDILDEHKRWWCDHAQVAGFVVTELGFRRDSYDIAAALRGKDADKRRVPEALLPWQACIAWVDALKTGKDAPDDAQLASFSVGPGQVEQVTERFDALFEAGSSFAWMFRGAGKEDSKDA